MKPEKLILCGWGPYKEKQEIDFTRLSERGLFLITGPTGAGKTTIFDAITYALYGSMSGQVREKNSVRSDFAGEDTATYVELSMTHGGKTYFIYRNPEYVRPKKRKTGSCDLTKEKERAYMILPDGNKVEGSSEVNNKVREILRLDYKQFKQLSLIAQGEFARLLTASSSEKSKIFREIFDTELYDKAAGLLRSKSSNLYKQVIEYRHRMEEDIAFFVPAKEDAEKWQALTLGEGLYYDEILNFLQLLCKSQKHILDEMQKNCQTANEEAKKLAMQVAEAEKTKSLFDKKVSEEKKREELLQKQPYIDRLEETLYKAKQAMTVSAYEQAFKYAVDTLKELSKRQESFEEELKYIDKELQEQESFREKRNLLENAYEIEKQEEYIAQRQREATAHYEEQIKMLTLMQKDYLEAETAESEAKSEYEKTDKVYRHAMAGIMASKLQENSPCPVCGSLHHPQKALLSADMPTASKVEAEKQRYEEKRQISLALHGKAAAMKERADAALEALEQIKKESLAVSLEKQKQETFVSEYVRANSYEQFVAQKKKYDALVVRKGEKEAQLCENRKEIQKKTDVAEEAKLTFVQKQQESGFSDADSYEKAFLPKEEIERLEQELVSYRETKHANQQLLLHLEEELRGKISQDIQALNRQLETAQMRREESFKKLEEKKHYLQDVERLLSSLRQKNEKKQKLEEEYGIVKRLDDAVCGNNRLRLVFEQYVLAAYFEEILKAANIRLRTMSSGRYELRRVEAVGDGRKKDNLEIEVLDYYTGKYRSVKTLSGGESFKTSLALALGMSDVVQALSGGVRVEALFIDEGFGSLDSESLEQASMTLQALVEKDRLIGIISHVPELAEKITSKIQIHKTNAGSRAEIVVS